MNKDLYELFCNAWKSLALIGAAAILVIVLSAVNQGIRADKTVRFYYLTGGGNGHAACVTAHYEWKNNMDAYCSPDINSVLNVLQQANAALPKK